MKHSSFNIKKILVFSQKKAFFVFSQGKAFIIFPEMEPCTFQSKHNPSGEKFLYFRKWKLRKSFLYFLRRELVLYFGKSESGKKIYISEK